MASSTGRDGHATKDNVSEPLQVVKREPSYLVYVGTPYKTAKHFISDQFITNNGGQALHHYGGDFYEFGGTRYSNMEDQTMRRDMYRYLDKCMTVKNREIVPFDPTSEKVSSVLDALEAEVHLPTNVVTVPGWIDRDAPNLPDPRDLVLMRNGMLHLPSGELLPHTPNYFSVYGLDYDYDPDLSEPEVFLNFLDSVWGDDQESKDTLQEWYGYLLTADTRQQKMLMILGPKRSGKGTLGRSIRDVVGPPNVAGPTLASIMQNFGLQPLINKQVAIISDARLGRTVDQKLVAERLLSISGEDALTIDRKYKEPATIRLPCRIIIMSNDMPQIADESGAFASRFNILKMTRSFYGKEDIHLSDKLYTERASIFNWAYKGLMRLRERGHFLQPKSGVLASQELSAVGNPLSSFVSQCCDIGPNLLVPVDVLYKAYCEHCNDNMVVLPATVQVFGTELRKIVPNLEVPQRVVVDKKVRVYLGIGLKDV